MKIKLKIASSVCCLALLFLAGSCAKGIEDTERFSVGVTNQQLTSPQLDEKCFTTLVNSDGSESVKITWPVVYGAGGYKYSLSIVDDPTKPEVLVKDSVIDGLTSIFKKKEDTKFEISLLTMGNEKLNNKEALTPSVFVYNTAVPATVIPEGEDIAEYINANIQTSDQEQGFELMGGKTYTLNSPVDFGLNTITFRGDKMNRPTVVVGEKGYISTQGGLKVKFINFDCTQMKALGVLTLSASPDESLSTEALGYKANGANQNGFVINAPVIFQECNFKNVPHGMLYGNKQPWSLRDFRIRNCIVQLNNTGSNSVLNLHGSSNGLIKTLTLENNTFYNLNTTSTAYFIRYSNQSNAQPQKIFGNNDRVATMVVVNNTFSRTFASKDFANNLPNTNTLVTTFNYNIFYDVYRLYQAIQTQAKKTTIGNTLIAPTLGTQSNDVGGRKDNSGRPYATEEDPQFAGPIDLEFDLTLPKGGVDFKPSGSVAVENKSGDPRWYE